MSHYQNFTPPFEIPESWEWVRLEDICATITDGDHQAPPKANSGIPFLVISDIINGDISFKKARYVSKDYFSSIQEERKPKYGDILFTVTGSYGVPVKVETQKPFCFQRHIGLIRPLLIGEILYWWLQSAYIKGTCDKKATGTAQKTVSLSILRELRIPLPPKKEQERIVAEINEIQSLIEGISGSRKNISESIRKTKLKILDLAMQGKLVPQDPTDEPAGDMLMRINPKAKIITDTPHYHSICKQWIFSELQYVSKITMGQSPNGDSINNEDGIEFHQGKLYFGDTFLSVSPDKTNAPIRIIDGVNIILCVRAPVGIVNKCDRKICIGRGLSAISPTEVVNDGYLFYALKFLKPVFDANSTGWKGACV